MLKQFTKTEYGVQGRANFMAHVRDKLTFRAASLL